MQNKVIGVSAATVITMILTSVYATTTMLAPWSIEFPSAWTTAAAFVSMVVCLYLGLPSAARVSASAIPIVLAMMAVRSLMSDPSAVQELLIGALILSGVGYVPLLAMSAYRRWEETGEHWLLCVVRTTLFVSVVVDAAVILGSIKTLSAHTPTAIGAQA